MLGPKLMGVEAILDDLLNQYQLIVAARLSFNTIGDLEADDALAQQLSLGEIVHILEHGGFDLMRFDVDPHFTTAGGAGFRVSMDVTSPLYLGAIGDALADDAPAIDLISSTGASMIDLAGRTYRYVGTYVPDRPIRNGQIVDDNGTQDYMPILPSQIATVAQILAAGPVDQLITIEGLLEQLRPNVVQTAYKSTALFAASFSHSIAELTTQITTRKANSRVRLSVSLSVDLPARSLVKVFRNGSEIMANEDAAGTRLAGAFSEFHSTTAQTLHTTTFTFLDDVTVAGLYEYTFEVHSGTSAQLGLNRSIADTDNATSHRGVSVVLLEEIEAGPA